MVGKITAVIESMQEALPVCLGWTSSIPEPFSHPSLFPSTFVLTRKEAGFLGLPLDCVSHFGLSCLLIVIPWDENA